MEAKEEVEISYGSMISNGTNLNIVNHNQTLLESFKNYRIIEKLSEKTEENKDESGDVVMEKEESDEEKKVLTLLEKNNLEELNPLVYNTLLNMKMKLAKNNKRFEIFQNFVASCPIDIY